MTCSARGRLSIGIVQEVLERAFLIVRMKLAGRDQSLD
jgi:hypothetical protein